MSKLDYYSILGVEKNATDKEIKKAYRELAKEHHPDKGGDEERFKEISEAYDTLSDPKKKTQYDRFGHGRPTMGGFGGQQRYTAQGQTIRVTVNLTLEEMFSGVNKTFKYNRLDSCKDCDGLGGHDITSCPYCKGTGMITETLNTPFGQIHNTTTCMHCHGQGQTYKEECKTCKGKELNVYQMN
jgi:molecular chaperone DnaJ